MGRTEGSPERLRPSLGMGFGNHSTIANQRPSLSAGRSVARGCCGSTDRAIVVPRRSWRENSLGKTSDLHEERKRSQKERKRGLWKLTRGANRGKIKEPKRFCHRLHRAWKTLRKKALRVSHQLPQARRRRSALKSLNFCRKNGKHFRKGIDRADIVRDGQLCRHIVPVTWSLGATRHK